MADYKIDAANYVRGFLWDQFTTSNIFDEEEYYSDSLGELIIPIIPVQQVPDLNQFLNGKKHIVYDKTGMTWDDTWLICNEKMQFTIYAIDIADINEMRNFIIDLFRRSDESARDINNFMPNNSKIRFHTIYMSDISPVAPSEELQGFLSADVIIEVKYSREVNSAGRYN
jgi:hypothetical protein